MLRLVLGFVVAPLVPILALSALIMGPENFGRLLPPVAVVSYVITVLLAVPLYLAMRALHWTKLWHFLVAGALMGVSFDALLYGFAAFSNGPGMTTLRQDGVDLIVEGKYTFDGYISVAKRLCVYALTGVGAGFVFWWLAIRGARSNPTVETDARESGARGSP
jgi:uncharacterized PurR-regulated membrane protein YhhQ (DUF165 family)